MYNITTKENYAMIEPKRKTIYVMEVEGYEVRIRGILISNDSNFLPVEEKDRDYDYGIFDLDDGNIYYIKRSDIIEIIEWHGTITQ